MAEHLPLEEQVEDPPILHELHRAGPHHVQEPGGLAGPAQDRGPGREELDLDRAGHPPELLRRQDVERGVAGQEGLDLHHGRSMAPGRAG